MNRRDLFVVLLAVALPTACRPSGHRNEAATGAVARRWSHLVTNEVTDFGHAVQTESPESIDHAAATLGASGDLDAACQADLDEGSLAVVTGWSMPTTLAGLAGILASDAPT